MLLTLLSITGRLHASSGNVIVLLPVHVDNYNYAFCYQLDANYTTHYLNFIPLPNSFYKYTNDLYC